MDTLPTGSRSAKAIGVLIPGVTYTLTPRMFVAALIQ